MTSASVSQRIRRDTSMHFAYRRVSTGRLASGRGIIVSLLVESAPARQPWGESASDDRRESSSAPQAFSNVVKRQMISSTAWRKHAASRMEEPLHFGPIVIRPAERSVSVDGRPVAVGARAFDVLLALATRRDRLVNRDELLEAVWPGVIVEEHNITAQISTLRKLLGPHVIATVPGRGYRFVAAADEVPATAAGAIAAQRNNLPQARTRFIGREAEIAQIRQLLEANRLITLTGIGGSGKTRLAIECARQLADERFDDVWFVDLAPLT